MDLVDLINCLSNGPLHVGACTITLAGLDSTLVAAVQHPPSTTQYGSDSMFTSRATNNPLSSAVTDQCNFIEDDEMECAQTSKKAYFHTSKQVYRTDAAVDIIASQSSLLPSTSSGSSLQYVPDTTTETGEEDVDEWDCTSTVYTCLGKVLADKLFNLIFTEYTFPDSCDDLLLFFVLFFTLHLFRIFYSYPLRISAGV